MAADGGPAFPRAGSTAGMSLRDWFAGQALARSNLEYNAGVDQEPAAWSMSATTCRRHANRTQKRTMTYISKRASEGRGGEGFLTEP